MIPPMMLVPHNDRLYPKQRTPDVSRAEVFARARRDEMDAMLFELRSTQQVHNNESNDSFSFGSFFNGVRRSIGDALVNAGTRLQNPA